MNDKIFINAGKIAQEGKALPQVLWEDTQQIISDGCIPFESLRGCAVLVTGATGLIGSALLGALSAADQKYGLGLRLHAAGRDAQKGKVLCEAYGAHFLAWDIRDPLPELGQIDHIFHCAAVTQSREMAAHPVDVTEIAVKGTMHLLSLAREKAVKSMVYLSSMEVYGITDPLLANVTEKDLGTIDVISPRSCYPESKRLCESLCIGYAAQYGVPVKIARLSQTFGAGCPKNDPRVFAQFARSAMAGEDIILHTEGRSRGNYCYLSDAVRALLLLLLKGESGEAYNIVNTEACMTIREMAELVAQTAGKGKVAVETAIPADIALRGYAPDVTLRLSADKLMKLGWQPKYNLAQMYERLIAFWQEEA